MRHFSGTIDSQQRSGRLNAACNVLKAFAYPILSGIDRLLFPTSHRIMDAVTHREIEQARKAQRRI